MGELINNLKNLSAITGINAQGEEQKINIENQNTRLSSVFQAAVNTARNQKNINIYDKDGNGTLSDNEMMSGLEEIVKDNHKKINKDKFKLRKKQKNDKSDIDAFSIINELNEDKNLQFYKWSKKSQKARKAQIESGTRDAEEATRRMLDRMFYNKKGKILNLANSKSDWGMKTQKQTVSNLAAEATTEKNLSIGYQEENKNQNFQVGYNSYKYGTNTANEQTTLTYTQNNGNKTLYIDNNNDNKWDRKIQDNGTETISYIRNNDSWTLETNDVEYKRDEQGELTGTIIKTKKTANKATELKERKIEQPAQESTTTKENVVPVDTTNPEETVTPTDTTKPEEILQPIETAETGDTTNQPTANKPEEKVEIPTYPPSREKFVQRQLKNIDRGLSGFYDTAQNVQIAIDRAIEGDLYPEEIREFMIYKLQEKMKEFPADEVAAVTDPERRKQLSAARQINTAMLNKLKEAYNAADDEVTKGNKKAGIITHLGHGINTQWLDKEDTRKTAAEKLMAAQEVITELNGLKYKLTAEEFAAKFKELTGENFDFNQIVNDFKAGEDAASGAGKMYVIGGVAIAVTGGLAAGALAAGGAAAGGATAAGAATAKTAITAGAIAKGAAIGAGTGAVVGGTASIATDTVDKLTNNTDNAEDFSAEGLTQMTKNAGAAAAMGAVGGAAGGAIAGTLMGTTLSTGTKIGVDIAGNTIVGAGLDYATTGQITLAGTAMNAGMSILGGAASYKGLTGLNALKHKKITTEAQKRIAQEKAIIKAREVEENFINTEHRLGENIKSAEDSANAMQETWARITTEANKRNAEKKAIAKAKSAETKFINKEHRLGKNIKSAENSANAMQETWAVQDETNFINKEHRLGENIKSAEDSANAMQEAWARQEAQALKAETKFINKEHRRGENTKSAKESAEAMQKAWKKQERKVGDPIDTKKQGEKTQRFNQSSKQLHNRAKKLKKK